MLRALWFLLADLASTLIFLAVVLATGNIPAAIVAGMVLGAAQIAWQLALEQPIGAIQWIGLVLVAGLGSASLITGNPHFVMIKPSLAYLAVGIVMLKRGWMNRYMPPIVLELVPDIVVTCGYVWSGLMFFSAGLNAAVALSSTAGSWAAFMSIYGILSKAAVFFIQYTVMRSIAVRRRRALPVSLAAAQETTLTP